jgi:CBS domain-containing protein
MKKSLDSINYLLDKEIYSIASYETAKYAFNKMLSKKITSLPIIDNYTREIVGIISMSDIKVLSDPKCIIAELLNYNVLEFLKISRQYVAQRMDVTPRAVTHVVHCKRTDTLDYIVNLMLDSNVHHIYVLEEARPIGVVSFVDILRLVS